MRHKPFEPDDLEPFCSDPAEERQRLREQLAQAYRLCGALRLGDLGDGHISARDPQRKDHFWLLRFGVSFHLAQARDMVLVAPDGSTVDDEIIGACSAPINETAYFIHHPIHAARPDAGAAAHMHTHWGVAFSTERRLLQPINQESTLFFENHSLFDDEEVQVLSAECGRRIATALGQLQAVILANHGFLATGASPAEAVAWLIFMERVAETHLKARDPVALSAAAARVARDALLSKGMAWRAFRYLAMRHLS